MSYRPLHRRLRVLLPAAALLLAGLAALAWLDNATNRGVTYTPALPPIAGADVPRLGVNAYNIQYEAEPAKVTRTLELARELGARFVRIQMPWEDIEIAGKGDFWDHKNDKDAWAKYDFIVAEAQRLGLELIVRVDRPPAWARAQADATPQFQAGIQENGNSTGPPDNYADYADFLGAVAGRYRGKLRYLQVWNEPNLAYEWNWRMPSPEEFVSLLRPAYAAVKSANPDAVVLFPSLSPTDGLEPRIAPINELEYLDRVYAAGGAQYFDIMSAQAYGLGQPPSEHRYVFLRGRGNWSWSRPIDTRIDVSRVVLLREVMQRNGDGGKAIWISEFGYNSAPPPLLDAAGRTAWGPPVSEQQKGEYMVGQLERASREWPWIGVMNVWFLRWGGPDPDPRDTTPYFAIVDRDFNPLPAYTMLKAHVAGGPVAGVGAHAWSHPAVTQQAGGWSVRFEGTSFALARLVSPLTISIDGGAPIHLNPLVGGGTLTIATGLADGPHTALIEGPRPPEAFLVGRARPLPWLWSLAPALLLAGLAVVGALALRAALDRGR